MPPGTANIGWQFRSAKMFLSGTWEDRRVCGRIMRPIWRGPSFAGWWRGNAWAPLHDR